jgi:uncharacterized membrane protein YbaN (DUF454 family)
MKNHYLKPRIFALCLFVVSLAMIFGGFFYAEAANEMNYFGLAFIGIFLFIMSVTIFFVYRNLQRKLNALFDSTPLLEFVLSDEQAQSAINENNKALKSYNKSIWLTIIFFCGIFALGGPLFVEDGMLFAIICLAIAVFFTFVFLIATYVRTNKLKSANHSVILNEKGVYFMGSYYPFKMAGTWLTEANYDPETYLIKLVVTALTTAGPSDSIIIIPIPLEYRDKIESIVSKLPTVTL